MTDLVTRLREPHFMSDAQHRATLDGVLDTVKLMRAERREAADKITRLTSLLDEAREALSWFLEDPLFQVAVGGNPNAVDQMIDRARATLSKLQNQSTPSSEEIG